MTDDQLRAAVRRLLDEYWEDNSRPPSFVTIGDLKAALASVPDEGPIYRPAGTENVILARPAVPALDVERLRTAARLSYYFCDDDEHRSNVYNKRECYCEKVSAVLAKKYAALTAKEPTVNAQPDPQWTDPKG